MTCYQIGLLTGDSGNAILKDIMENTRTDITVDFGGPPGLPRKVRTLRIRVDLKIDLAISSPVDLPIFHILRV